MNAQWEARSSLRWGSRHEGYFKTQADAEAFARCDIEQHGGVGRVTALLNNVVYYDNYAEDS